MTIHLYLHPLPRGLPSSASRVPTPLILNLLLLFLDFWWRIRLVSYSLPFRGGGEFFSDWLEKGEEGNCYGGFEGLGGELWGVLSEGLDGYH